MPFLLEVCARCCRAHCVHARNARRQVGENLCRCLWAFKTKWNFLSRRWQRQQLRVVEGVAAWLLLHPNFWFNFWGQFSLESFLSEKVFPSRGCNLGIWSKINNFTFVGFFFLRIKKLLEKVAFFVSFKNNSVFSAKTHAKNINNIIDLCSWPHILKFSKNPFKKNNF